MTEKKTFTTTFYQKTCCVRRNVKPNRKISENPLGQKKNFSTRDTNFSDIHKKEAHMTHSHRWKI